MQRVKQKAGFKILMFFGLLFQILDINTRQHEAG